MERFSPQDYMIKQASNEILSNMKVKDLVLPFLKSPRTWISHVWLESYGSTFAKSIRTSSMHNFWTKRPNGVVLFATFLFWRLLSKTCITSHAFSSHNHLVFYLNFGGKNAIWKISIFYTFYQLHLIKNDIWSMLRPNFVYCSMHPMHMRVNSQLAITLAFINLFGLA